MSNVGASIIRGLEQAAENRIEWSETLETMPQGLKPRLTICGLLAPFGFSQGRLESVPFQNSGFYGVFPQPVELAIAYAQGAADGSWQRVYSIDRETPAPGQARKREPKSPLKLSGR